MPARSMPASDVHEINNGRSIDTAPAAQSCDESLLSLLNAPCLLLFCFRLFYAYELVEDDVGEETIAQTSTAEQSGPL